MNPSMVLEMLSEIVVDARKQYQSRLEAGDSEEDLVRVTMEYRKIIQLYVDKLPQ